MLASVTKKKKNPPSRWLNTIRESSPISTSLVYSVIVSYMGHRNGLPTSVLNTSATWLIPWSLKWNHSASLSKPLWLLSHSEQNPMWPKFPGLQTPLPQLLPTGPLCSFWNVPKDSHLKVFCTFSSVCPEYTFPGYPHSVYPHLVREACAEHSL